MDAAQAVLALSPKQKSQVFKSLTTTLSANFVAGVDTTITLTSVADLISGNSSGDTQASIVINLDDGTQHQTTYYGLDTGLKQVTLTSLPAVNITAGVTVYAATRFTWSVPGSVIANGGMLSATVQGPGNGGAGGHTAAGGGGGGGGGAGSCFRDMPVFIDTTVSSPQLKITVGTGGAGGVKGANGGIGAFCRIDTISGSLLYALGTGRPARDASSQATFGGAADGGIGGDGAPLVTVPLVAATTSTGVEGGPRGGIAGTGAANGGAGYAAVQRGFYGTTGGAGGGGASSNAASNGGSGGADDKHGDQVATGTGGGGAGGGSGFGGAAYGGIVGTTPSGKVISGSGRDSNGPGGGGGGGATNAPGGKGGDGLIVLKWQS